MHTSKWLTFKLPQMASVLACKRRFHGHCWCMVGAPVITTGLHFRNRLLTWGGNLGLLLMPYGMHHASLYICVTHMLGCPFSM